MRPTVTRGATHNYQKPDNWNAEKDGECGDLQVRAETYGESKIIQLVSTWKPNSAELKLLKQGGVVEVMLLTPIQPPMAVSVVEPIEPALIKYVVPQGGLTINEIAHGDDSHGER